MTSRAQPWSASSKRPAVKSRSRNFFIQVYLILRSLNPSLRAAGTATVLSHLNGGPTSFFQFFAQVTIGHAEMVCRSNSSVQLIPPVNGACICKLILYVLY